VRAAHGALALLGEEFGVHQPRHVRSFVASLPGASVISELLPAAAVAGLGLAFVEAGKKAYEFVEKVREMPKAIAEGFESMHDKAQLANDELGLTNDRLEEQIAKLTGKHVNALASELDEARVAADKLLASLMADSKATEDLLKNNSVGTLGSLLLNKAPTAPVEDVIKNQNKAVNELARSYREQLDEATNASEVQRIKSEQRIKTIELEKRQLSDLKDLYASNQRESTTRGGELFGGPIIDAVQAMIKGQMDLRSSQVGQQSGENRHVDDEGGLKRAQAQIEARKEQQRIIGIILSEAIQGYNLEAESQNRVTEALQETSRTFFRLDDEEEAQRRKSTTEAAADYRKLAADKAAGYHADIDAAKENFQQLSELTQLSVDLGLESASERTEQLKQASADAYKIETEKLDQEMALYGSWTVEYKRLLDQRKKLDADYFKEQIELARNASQEGLQGAINDVIRRASEIGVQIKQELESALNSVNETLSKMLTGQYKKGDWKKTAQGILGGASKTALQDAEGFGLKALGLGGGGKLGTKGNPMHVTMEGGIPGVGSGAGSSGVAGMASKGLLGMLNNSNWASSLFGGNLFGSGGMLAGGLAGGGSFSPGDYLVGERGPEIMSIGSSGFMHNADKTRTMVSGGGGGGDIHYHIDARGTDPALTQHNVMRGMRQTHQQSVKDSAHVISEHAKRVPQR